VAVLNVSGALVHKSRMQADSTPLLGYNSIAADLQDAMDQPDVNAILQIWDSPGGEAQGAFQYADTALALRGKKPMIALADGMAASAAYLGASAADSLHITRTGYAGSIGVVMRHIDMSAALMTEHIRVNQIYAGARKIDGNPYEPLSDAARADYQAEVNALYDDFIAAVARARPGLSAAAIRATQAATYRGPDAVQAGLADRITTADALITELAATRTRLYPAGPANAARITTQPTDSTMTQTAPTPALDATAAAAAHAATPAATSAAPASAAELDAARSAGAVQERARITAIQSHPNAGAQHALVQHCIATGLAAEAACAILSAAQSPAAQAAPANPLAAAMARVPNPGISGIEPDADAQDNPAGSLAAQILQAYRAAA
jgi:ClpP class serine protease